MSESQQRLIFEENASRYINNCQKFDIKVDSSVVIALRTGWTILKPTKSFNEGSMLPLLDILKTDKTIVKLNLSSAGMHDNRYHWPFN